jgi:hypothetical protein
MVRPAHRSVLPAGAGWVGSVYVTAQWLLDGRYQVEQAVGSGW